MCAAVRRNQVLPVNPQRNGRLAEYKRDRTRRGPSPLHFVKIALHNSQGAQVASFLGRFCNKP